MTRCGHFSLRPTETFVKFVFRQLCWSFQTRKLIRCQCLRGPPCTLNLSHCDLGTHFRANNEVGRPTPGLAHRGERRPHC